MAVIYRDINQFTPKTRSHSENARAVYQSVYNIISTRKGERLFQPTFGVNLEDELFELNDDRTQDRIKQAINSGISEWEPRVTVNLSETEISVDEDKNQVSVSIVFTINGLDDQKYQIIENISR